MAHKPRDSWQIRLAEGMLVRCADGTHCRSFRHLFSFSFASSRDMNQLAFRHSSRRLPFKDSMWTLSVGVPGLEKTSWIFRS